MSVIPLNITDQAGMDFTVSVNDDSDDKEGDYLPCFFQTLVRFESATALPYFA